MINMYKSFVIILLLISAGNLTAQGNNMTDALSRMESAISNSKDEFSMRDNYFLGRTVAAQILARYSLYTEKPVLIDYLNLICKALAINSPAPEWYSGYHVMILDAPELNAFSTPGGHIFVTRGLISAVSSEDMLAAVIAHELAHIQLNHGTAEIKNARLIQYLGNEQQRISQSVPLEIQRQVFTEIVDEIVQSLFTKGYSQLQEFEADSNAYNLLVSAGYNDRSLIELLRILESESQNQIGSLNSTHPLPVQRIANLQKVMNANRFANNSMSVRKNRFDRIMERNAN